MAIQSVLSEEDQQALQSARKIRFGLLKLLGLLIVILFLAIADAVIIYTVYTDRVPMISTESARHLILFSIVSSGFIFLWVERAQLTAFLKKYVSNNILGHWASFIMDGDALKCSVSRDIPAPCPAIPVVVCLSLGGWSNYHCLVFCHGKFTSNWFVSPTSQPEQMLRLSIREGGTQKLPTWLALKLIEEFETYEEWAWVIKNLCEKKEANKLSAEQWEMRFNKEHEAHRRSGENYERLYGFSENLCDLIEYAIAAIEESQRFVKSAQGAEIRTRLKQRYLELLPGDTFRRKRFVVQQR